MTLPKKKSKRPSTEFGRVDSYQWEYGSGKVIAVGKMNARQARTALCDMMDFVEELNGALHEHVSTVNETCEKFRFPKIINHD